MESVRALQDVQEDLHRRGAEDATQDHPTMEYLDVELYVGHSWFVYGTAHQALDEIPYFAKYYAQFTKKIPTHHYNIPKLESPEAYGCSSCKERETNP